MTATYRFRIELLDRPGLLARVTDALAAAGANVESIDIHRPQNGVSVDEIGVEAVEDWDPDVVAGTLDALEGVRVLAHRRERGMTDPVVNALRWARIMVAAGPGDHELELSRAILEVTGASVAWSESLATAATSPAGYAALAARAPVIKRADVLPAGREVEIDGPFWILAVADDPDQPSLVGFAARPIATAFSTSEMARLEALMRLRRALAPRTAHQGVPAPVT